MPPKKDFIGSVDQSKNPKRKAPPQSSSNSQGTNTGRAVKRVKMIDSRSILTQKADAALKNGELDLQAFLKAREFEIKALEDGMQRSKASSTQRAFQQVPRDMRRRTASHNVKKVPKRLQHRAAREMREDNTPTVNSNKKKLGSSRGRIRAETAKRLGILAAKRAQKNIGQGKGVEPRVPRPKIRRDLLNDPPKPISRFRKRQIHKSWLPTHMWHAKRARMTEPKKPLWRFAIPITSTEKSYRPTHRAGGARGAVVWDMSYMSTIGLEGPVESLEKVLKGIGILDLGLWDGKGEKWMAGKRAWTGWMSREIKGKRTQIGPSTVIWCSSEQDSTEEADHTSKKRPLRRVFVRVHPAAFLETWRELLRLSKMQRPTVHIEDLRFEIGSINVTGPGSTEALLGILHPYCQPNGARENHAQAFSSLAGVTNPGSVPANSILAFSISDPRLHYPPRAAKVPKSDDEEANFALLDKLSTWPVDEFSPSSALFDRNARFKATRLPAQKSINRRKSQAKPGEYPSMVPTDPPIPIILFASRSASSAAGQGTWTLLAPWKCILPTWYGLVHYPLSSGGNPRFGGLDELRQIHFEQGVPWFPADYPGTNSGFLWEMDERERRKAQWDRRPKGKRIEWDSLDLGAGRKGEIGRGWACDFERVLALTPLLEGGNIASTTQDTEILSTAQPERSFIESPIEHLNSKTFTHLLSSSNYEPPHPSTVATVRITLTTRGVATPCARIYRLPQASASSESSTTSGPTPTTREEWMALLPAASASKTLPNPKSKAARGLGRIPLDTPVPQRIRLLAQSLLQNPPLPYPANRDDGHPLVPGEEDLIGFVTTGEFNLAEGKGVAVGTLAVAKVLEGLRRDRKVSKEGRLCIVRNAGENIGRLARWEAV
ncbi:Ribonucleases P/MRP protein subunit pop1 [Lachnellula cervina]|uniref:Ribonucleases P/MRP protein subunit pop1 n=1 Tax=Lachnellula cervina TaxID=1316786 RepID=A0A7D8UVR0_9HELO|nr:Ribonucleases P/MRP protein subunit pop1 [Lachnellula cervina]